MQYALNEHRTTSVAREYNETYTITDKYRKNRGCHVSAGFMSYNPTISYSGSSD